MKNFLLVLLLAFASLYAANAEEGPDAPADDAVVVAPPEGEVTISTFYDALTPDGVWIQDADYGWVWQPSEAKTVVEWKPYVHGGHWVWTDCGWYWESDYRWGWAAYHYGRWCTRAGIGWVWVPDCTWGPAWVNWRECETHIGWAPLPPACGFDAKLGFSFHSKHVDFGFEFGLGVDDFCFVPCGALLEIDLWHHHCHHDECVKVYNKTVIHNTYVVKNNVVINNGCAREGWEKRTGKHCEEVKVRSAGFKAGEKINGEHRSGKEIVAYRPQVKKEAPKSPAEVKAHRKEEFEHRQKVEPHKEAPKHVEPHKEAPKAHKEAPKQVEPRKEAPRHEAKPAPKHDAPVHREAPKASEKPKAKTEGNGLGSRSTPAQPAPKAAPLHRETPKAAPKHEAPKPAPAPKHEAAPKPAAPVPHHEAPPVHHSAPAPVQHAAPPVQHAAPPPPVQHSAPAAPPAPVLHHK